MILMLKIHLCNFELNHFVIIHMYIQCHFTIYQGRAVSKNDDGMVLISNITVLLRNYHGILSYIIKDIKMLPSISSHLKYKVGSLPQLKIWRENWLWIHFNTYYSSRLILVWKGKKFSLNIYTKIMASWPPLSHKKYSINKPNGIQYY